VLNIPPDPDPMGPLTILNVSASTANTGSFPPPHWAPTHMIRDLPLKAASPGHKLKLELVIGTLFICMLVEPS
jgi:hypothetical protein